MMIQLASRFLTRLAGEVHARRPRRNVFSSSVATIELLESRELPAATGFVIVPTYDPATIGNLPNHAAIESTINTVLARYQTVFTNPITVNIKFMGTTDPKSLAFSVAPRDPVPYTEFLAALKSSKTTADDAAAIKSLPNTTTEPVQKGENVGISTANEKSLGIIPARGTDNDGTVTFNFSQLNIDRVTVDPDNYDLATTAAHEIDELLGLGSNMPDTGETWIEDLFRYGLNHHRSYATSPDARAFLSFDGKTNLIEFNQDSTGDYGDWKSGGAPLVQNAFGTPGYAGIVDPNIEYRALDVLGYHYVNATNRAPHGTAHTISVAKHAVHTFSAAEFGFTDPDNAPSNTLLAVKITTLPALGKLTDNGVAVVAGTRISVADINAGKLKYKPATNNAGSASSSFTFQVQDNGGTANGGIDTDPTAKKLVITVK